MDPVYVCEHWTPEQMKLFMESEGEWQEKKAKAQEEGERGGGLNKLRKMKMVKVTE